MMIISAAAVCQAIDVFVQCGSCMLARRELIFPRDIEVSSPSRIASCAAALVAQLAQSVDAILMPAGG